MKSCSKDQPFVLSKTARFALMEQLNLFFQSYLPLGRAMGLEVSHYDQERLSLTAPLNLNDNDKQTAFGGSLYCVAVMSCWSSVYLRALREGITQPAIVVTQANIEYLAPVVDSSIVATCTAGNSEQWQEFFVRNQQGKSAKISLYSEIKSAGKTAVKFSGSYALKP